MLSSIVRPFEKLLIALDLGVKNRPYWRFRDFPKAVFQSLFFVLATATPLVLLLSGIGLIAAVIAYLASLVLSSKRALLRSYVSKLIGWTMASPFLLILAAILYLGVLSSPWLRLLATPFIRRYTHSFEDAVNNADPIKIAQLFRDNNPFIDLAHLFEKHMQAGDDSFFITLQSGPTLSEDKNILDCAIQANHIEAVKTAFETFKQGLFYRLEHLSYSIDQKTIVFLAESADENILKLVAQHHPGGQELSSTELANLNPLALDAEKLKTLDNEIQRRIVCATFDYYQRDAKQHKDRIVTVLNVFNTMRDVSVPVNRPVPPPHPGTDVSLYSPYAHLIAQSHPPLRIHELSGNTETCIEPTSLVPHLKATNQLDLMVFYAVATLYMSFTDNEFDEYYRLFFLATETHFVTDQPLQTVADTILPKLYGFFGNPAEGATLSYQGLKDAADKAAAKEAEEAARTFQAAS